MRLPRRITVCGLNYDVALVRPGDPEPDDLAGNNGLLYPEAGKMWVRLQEDSRTRDTFVHEITHAVIKASGADNFLRAGARSEECFVSVFTPAMIAALHSARLLKGDK